MDLTNKSFRENSTGQLVKIVDQYKNISITDDNQRIDSSRLLDPNYYTEQIDPSNFFNTRRTYEAFAEKIKSIDSSKLPEDDFVPEVKFDNSFSPLTQESAIILSDPEDEIEELKRKYGASIDNSALQKQNELFSKILNEESEEITDIPKPPVSPTQTNNWNNTPTYHEPIPIQVEDPIITIFKGTKRNVPFSINLVIVDKIPRLDFIEMMEDSYEKSLIDFLAEEFTNKIISNPSLIKEKIKSEIQKMVYPQKVKVNKAPRKRASKKSEQTDDSGNIPQ